MLRIMEHFLTFMIESKIFFFFCSFGFVICFRDLVLLFVFFVVLSFEFFSA